MFVTPRPKYSLVPPVKKRKLSSAVEEVTFDSNAREDYLTGFHKRKLQRIKHAKEEAAKKERQDRIMARKVLRDGRKADLEERIKAMDSVLKGQGDAASDVSEEEGINGAEELKGLADGDTVNHKNEYSDDDRFTTVTVQAVDVSKEGLHKLQDSDNEETEATDASRFPKEESAAVAGREQPSSKNKKRTLTKKPPIEAQKKRKKFRYESKAERKATRYKEKSGNRAKAKARKG